MRACRSNWWICHLTNWYVKPDREGLVVAGKSGHRTRCRRHLVARRGPNRASSWCEWGVCAARKRSKWTPGLGCQCAPRLFKHWVWFGQIVLQTGFAHKVVQERALGQKLSQNVSPSPSCRPSGAESDVFFVFVPPERAQNGDLVWPACVPSGIFAWRPKGRVGNTELQ